MNFHGTWCVCIDIVEIWFGILMGKFHQILTELSAQDRPIFLFPDDNLSKHQWDSPNLVCALIMQRSDWDC